MQLTPNTALLMGPLYLICTLTVVLRATMQDTSTDSTSPTSRFFCITSKIESRKLPWLVQQIIDPGGGGENKIKAHALICPTQS